MTFILESESSKKVATAHDQQRIYSVTEYSLYFTFSGIIYIYTLLSRLMKHHHVLMTTTGLVLAISLALFDIWYLTNQRPQTSQSDILSNSSIQQVNTNLNAAPE